MEPITLAEIIEWTGAVPDRAVDPDTVVTQISKDTKTLQPGAVFVPLKGERFDGHDFIAKAAEAGAAAVFCSREHQPSPVPRLMVDNTLHAAQRLAAGYRRRLAPTVVGITGSVGKTTTSLMTTAILNTRWETASTRPDMNGQIGLTFDMFGLSAQQKVAVWEMGMSLPGELTRLSDMAQPDIAVINTIGTAHIEFFGTRERIRDAKLEILSGMPVGATLILNADEPLLWQMRGSYPRKTVWFGLDNPLADLRGTLLGREGTGQRLHVEGCGRSFDVFVPAIGDHHARNALAALLCGVTMGLTDGELVRGLGSFVSPAGRQRIVGHHGLTVMEDSYNASPDAVRASLKVLATLECKKRYAALGGMLELGAYAPEGHRSCGAAAAGVVSKLFLYGEGAQDYRRGALEAGMDPQDVQIFTDHDTMAQAMAEVVRPGDAILFKGSKLMHMERALQRLYELI